MPSKVLSWILFVAICFAAAAVGGWFTGSSVKTWYPELLKPVGTPPSWVFGPIWSVLYLLMATAAWVVWKQRHTYDVWSPLSLFFAQLILNAGWSFVFFRLRQPGLALLEILILLLAIGLTAVSFLRCSPTAFCLMTPYLGWVAYATYLNFGIWRLNRGAA